MRKSMKVAETIIGILRVPVLVLVLSWLATMTGCTFMHQDFDKYGKNYSQIPLHLLKIGDTTETVEEKLGKSVNIIGSKPFKDGLVEVWSYERWHAAFGEDYKEQEYWLYFLNGKLAQWGRPGDWQREADRIYELRVR